MQVPLEITFHQVPPSEEIEQLIKARATKLERFHHRIIRCRVAIEEPHRRHKNGTRYDVHLEVSIPGKVLSVLKEPDVDNEHQDLHQTLREAFSAMERQLESEAHAGREGRRHTGRAAAAIANETDR